MHVHDNNRDRDREGSGVQFTSRFANLGMVSIESKNQYVEERERERKEGGGGVVAAMLSKLQVLMETARLHSTAVSPFGLSLPSTVF